MASDPHLAKNRIKRASPGVNLAMIPGDGNNEMTQNWAQAPVVTKDSRTIARFNPNVEFICSIISISVLILVGVGPAFLLVIARADSGPWFGLIGALFTPIILTVLSKFRSWSLLLAIILSFLVIAPMLTYAYHMVTNQPFNPFEPGSTGVIVYSICCTLLILPICRWGLPFGHRKTSG